jgi:hypothetical protein
MPNGVQQVTKLNDERVAADGATLTVIARSVAFLALHAAELSNADLLTKATFLEKRMGLSRADCAAVLDSTAESVRKTLGAGKSKASGARRG